MIAVDGSDEARQAAQRGLELAQVFGSNVTILTVIEQKALQLTKTTDEKTQLREQGMATLTEIEKLASKFDKPVTTKLTEGKPVVRISKYAEEQNADLIIVGRQGLTGLGRRLLGGVTEQILYRSDIPVLVVSDRDHKGKIEDNYSRILLTTDGSENAEEAIPHGIGIAQHCGSTLYILNVVDLQAAGGVFDAGGLEKEFVERLEAGGQNAVDSIASKIKGSAPNLTMETAIKRTTSFEGAAAGIREYVEENEIDLVVMSSQGRSNLKRQLLGSVASTVLRTVDVPVLVIKQSD